MIKPLTTQGNITALDDRRVVHDARTAQGGSGAPVFGQSERVIGVNFAVFTENTASNFAVPVRYAITLLQRAGWKPKEQLDETSGNANTNQLRPRQRPRPTARVNRVAKEARSEICNLKSQIESNSSELIDSDTRMLDLQSNQETRTLYS